MKILITIVIIIFTLLVSFLALANFLKKRDQAKNIEDVIKFIKANPDKCSFSFIDNGETILSMNAYRVMPLASTYNIILAISSIYAIRNKELTLEEVVDIKDIDKFFFKNTDGNAHLEWIRRENIGTKCSMKQIISGMMKYSSNACTEYFVDNPIEC